MGGEGHDVTSDVTTTKLMSQEGSVTTGVTRTG